MQTIFVERVPQSRHNMILSDHAVKIMRSPLAGQYLITHRVEDLRETVKKNRTAACGDGKF
jgi:hypothetical protein